MSRLPQPGSDKDVWGDVLNNFLLTSHNPDGTIKPASTPVQSVAGRTGAVALSAFDVGLGNVNNTSDTTKPISTATQTALNNKVSKNGDTMSDDLGLTSSYASDDIAGGTDSTSRLNLHSYQRANYATLGETIRHFLMRKDAKAMEAYYIPKLGYDSNRDAIADFNPDGTPANLSQWRPISWTGSHYEANDHGSNHVHWELEIPDSSGALQGRLEVPFADPNTGAIGLDKTFIRTNLADLVVRTSNGQMLRLSSPAGNHKPIEFNLDSEGSTAFRRWVLRANNTAESGTNAGSDFQIINYDDSGALLSQAIHIERKTGTVVLGSATPTANVKLDINGDSIRLRTAKTPVSSTATGTAGQVCWDANFVYICVATNTWKRAALSSW